LLLYVHLTPLNVDFFLNGEEIMISNEYQGYLGNRLILGLFNAAVV